MTENSEKSLLSYHLSPAKALNRQIRLIRGQLNDAPHEDVNTHILHRIRGIRQETTRNTVKRLNRERGEHSVHTSRIDGWICSFSTLMHLSHFLHFPLDHFNNTGEIRGVRITLELIIHLLGMKEYL